MIPFLAQVSSETPISLAFMILMVCVVFIVVAITQLRVHAFLALILAAFLAGLMTEIFQIPTTSTKACSTVAWRWIPPR